MKHKLKVKGKLQVYMQLTLMLGLLFAAVDVWIYTIDVKAGVVLSGFVVFYLIMALVLLNFNRSILMNELISFATQYGQIQSSLLRDLELPSALLDENGKVIWTNRAFEQVIHKPKGFNKDIRTVLPAVTRDKMPTLEQEYAEVSFSLEEREYHAKMRRIPLAEMVQNSDIFESEGRYEGFLTILYLFPKVFFSKA